MTRTTRAFIITGLGALLGAALLHLLVLLGMSSVWPAMIHLTLFGWITAIILAVNCHTLPVFSGRNFPYPGLQTAHWATFTGGITLTTVGVLGQWRIGISVGLLLQLTAALLFVVNTLLLFLRGPRRAHRPPPPPIPDQRRIDRLGTQATKSAGLSLPVALLLLLAVQLDWLSGAWVLAAEHLVTLGWVMLMIVGVAYHVLPRFSGQGVRGPSWARAQLLCHGLALVLIVGALGFGWSHLFAIGGMLMALAIGLFAWAIWPTLVVVRLRSAPTIIPLKEHLP